MDLKDGWEKKALIGLGVVVVLIIIYAYFVPFSGTPDTNVSTNQPVPAQVVPLTYTKPVVNNSTSTTNNTTSNVNNTANIKSIVQTAYPDYTIGTPVYQNSININGTTYAAWEVLITKTNNPSYKIYVDYLGRIILKVQS